MLVKEEYLKSKEALVNYSPSRLTPSQIQTEQTRAEKSFLRVLVLAGIGCFLLNMVLPV